MARSGHDARFGATRASWAIEEDDPFARPRSRAARRAADPKAGAAPGESPAALDAGGESPADVGPVGPYLIYDDDHEVEVEAAAIAPPEPPRRSAGETARLVAEVVRTGTSARPQELDGVALWALAVHPPSLLPTLVSVLIGLLLAVPLAPLGTALAAGVSVVVVLAALAAHAGSNLLGEWRTARRAGFHAAGGAQAGGLETGSGEPADAETGGAATRTERAPGADGTSADAAGPASVLRSGLLPEMLPIARIEPARLRRTGVALLVTALALAGALAWSVDAGPAWLAATAVLIALALPWPAAFLRARGLGELAAAIVWGPLLTAAAYHALADAPPAWLWIASLPWGLLVGSVAIALHLDALAWRPASAAGTLPARIGEERARDLVIVLAEAFLVAIAVLVVFRDVGPWVLLVLLALPRLRRLAVACASARRDRPAEGAPPDALWYTRFAFGLAALSGALLLLGLALDLVLAAVVP